MTIDWSKASSEDLELIGQCCKRVRESEFQSAFDLDNLFMDVQAAHTLRNLNLRAMVEIELPELISELMNIQYHIDRKIGAIGVEYQSRYQEGPGHAG